MNSYQEIVDEFTQEELMFAHRALINSDLQAELYEKESPLLVFLFDSRKQDMLYEWVEDQEHFNIDEEEKPERIDYLDGC